MSLRLIIGGVVLLGGAYVFGSAALQADDKARAMNAAVDHALTAGPPETVAVQDWSDPDPDEPLDELQVGVQIRPQYNLQYTVQVRRAPDRQWYYMFAFAPGDRTGTNVTEAVLVFETEAEFQAFADRLGANGKLSGIGVGGTVNGRRISHSDVYRALGDLELQPANQFYAIRPFLTDRETELAALRRDPTTEMVKGLGGAAAAAALGVLLLLAGFRRPRSTGARARAQSHRDAMDRLDRVLQSQSGGLRAGDERAGTARSTLDPRSAAMSSGPAVTLSARGFADGDTPLDRVRRRTATPPTVADVAAPATREGRSAVRPDAFDFGPIRRQPTLGERLQQASGTWPGRLLAAVIALAIVGFLWRAGSGSAATNVIGSSTAPGRSFLSMIALAVSAGLVARYVRQSRRAIARDGDVTEAEVTIAMRGVPLYRKLTLFAKLAVLVGLLALLHLAGQAIASQGWPDPAIRRTVSATWPLLLIVTLVSHGFLKMTGQLVTRAQIRARLTEARLTAALDLLEGGSDMSGAAASPDGSGRRDDRVTPRRPVRPPAMPHPVGREARVSRTG